MRSRPYYSKIHLMEPSPNSHWAEPTEQLIKEVFQQEALKPYLRRANDLAQKRKAEDMRFPTINAYLEAAQTAPERTVANLAQVIMEQEEKTDKQSIPTQTAVALAILRLQGKI